VFGAGIALMCAVMTRWSSSAVTVRRLATPSAALKTSGGVGGLIWSSMTSWSGPATGGVRSQLPKFPTFWLKKRSSGSDSRISTSSNPGPLTMFSRDTAVPLTRIWLPAAVCLSTTVLKTARLVTSTGSAASAAASSARSSPVRTKAGSGNVGAVNWMWRTGPPLTCTVSSRPARFRLRTKSSRVVPGKPSITLAGNPAAAPYVPAPRPRGGITPGAGGLHAVPPSVIWGTGGPGFTPRVVISTVRPVGGKYGWARTLGSPAGRFARM
jgi:hypothetical protein